MKRHLTGKVASGQWPVASAKNHKSENINHKLPSSPLSPPPSPLGFTLVELLVVITIIGVLISLLLPAVQAAREAARRMQCSNGLKQMGLACLNHEQQYGYFPTGGWGCDWFGDPDRGFGKQQPGGWTYNILPFIEQQSLRDLGAGATVADKKVAASTLGRTPLPIFNCPSRRAAALYPILGAGFLANNANNVASAARTDYAANLGSNSEKTTQSDGTERAYTQGPAKNSPESKDINAWTDVPLWQPRRNGIMYLLSLTTTADIIDGTSNTYLIGEKYLTPEHYFNGEYTADNHGMFEGEDFDHGRWTGNTTLTNGTVTSLDFAPLQDTPSMPSYLRFGSAHSSGFNMVFCDGSVRTIGYYISLATHRDLGSRKDTNPVGSDEF